MKTFMKDQYTVTTLLWIVATVLMLPTYVFVWTSPTHGLDVPLVPGLMAYAAGVVTLIALWRSFHER